MLKGWDRTEDYATMTEVGLSVSLRRARICVYGWLGLCYLHIPLYLPIRAVCYGFPVISNER